MKKLCFLAVVMSLLGSGVFAATIGLWNRPAANGPGNYTDNSNWNGGLGPFTWTSTTTGDEVKMPTEGSIINLSVNAVDPNHTHEFRYSLASGPALGATMNILPGAEAHFWEFRVGAQGSTGVGSIGIVNQTGGAVTIRDLMLGRGGGSGVSPAQGYYTVSGGSITYESANGRLYAGCGLNCTAPNYTEGTFTVVGNDADLLFRAVWVGGDGGHYGNGTIAFQIDPDGVSPIKSDGTVNLGQYTTNPSLANAYLLLSATGDTTPQEDIVLVKITDIATSALAVNGTFDTLNGGPAAEGTEIVLGDNVYKLSYVYAADEDGKANDIALVHVANILDLAHDPVPASGATVEASLASLSWTLPEPNHPEGVLTCDVYLGAGADPNRLTMNKKTLGAGVSTVAINTTNFPTYGTLVNKTTYSWIVDVHDTSDPNVLYGIKWTFYVDNNVAPEVDAGDEQVVWLGKSGVPGQEVVNLDSTVIDDGLPNPPAAISYLWEQVDTGAPSVAVTPSNAADPSVTVTVAGTYEFKVTASDGDKQDSDTVQILVGSDVCDASHIKGEPYDAGDLDKNCVVDLTDLMDLIVANWMDCTDTQTNCGL